MALQDGTQLQNIGNALSGFSAGLQGQLPQFQQGLQQQQLINQQQQERQQQMAIERQKTMFTDAQAALNLLDSDNVDGVIQLGLNRLELLQNFPDANPEDTQRLTQLAIAAKNGSEEAKELLRAELENTVEIGKATGVLVEPVVEGATDLGKLKQDLNAGLITPEQYRDAVDRQAMEDLDIVQAYPADGEPMTLFRDGDKFRDVEGNEVEIAKDTRVVEGSTLQGGVDDLGMTNAIETQLVNKQASTRNYLDSVGDALQLLQDEPNINTFVGRASSIVNDLQQEAIALADTAGVDFSDYVNRADQTFDDDLGIQNNRMRSLITSLAFQAALSIADSSGRAVSDRDFDRFLKEIGSSANDPRAFATVLKDSAKRADRGYRNFYKSARNEEYEGDLGYSKIEEFDFGESAPSEWTVDNPATPQTVDDYNALPSGAIFIDPETNETKRKP